MPNVTPVRWRDAGGWWGGGRSSVWCIGMVERRRVEMSAKIKVVCSVKSQTPYKEEGPSLIIENEALFCENVRITLNGQVVIVRGKDVISAIQNAMNCE